MAIFEIKKEFYYQGMWRANFSDGDFLGLMWLEDGVWIFRYRFRYYMDTQVWASKDRRNSYQLKLPDGPGAKEKMFESIGQMLNVSCEKGLCESVEYYPCEGNGEVMAQLMASGINGLHAKRMTQAEHDEYTRTGKLPKEDSSQ